MKKLAKDGTLFRVFHSNSGDYVASEAEGTHYAPPAHSSLPQWTDVEAVAALDRAVAEYEYQQYIAAVAEAADPDWRTS